MREKIIKNLILTILFIIIYSSIAFAEANGFQNSGGGYWFAVETEQIYQRLYNKYGDNVLGKYDYGDGTVSVYLRNGIWVIDGKYYYFDSNGWITNNNGMYETSDANFNAIMFNGSVYTGGIKGQKVNGALNTNNDGTINIDTSNKYELIKDILVGTSERSSVFESCYKTAHYSQDKNITVTAQYNDFQTKNGAHCSGLGRAAIIEIEHWVYARAGENIAPFTTTTFRDHMSSIGYHRITANNGSDLKIGDMLIAPSKHMGVIYNVSNSQISVINMTDNISFRDIKNQGVTSVGGNIKFNKTNTGMKEHNYEVWRKD